jgi:hypothetical protein
MCTIYFACVTGNASVKKAYQNMNKTEKQIADSLIAYALDHEAIYTLLDTLKPISSVKFYKLPLVSKDSKQVDSAFLVLHSIQYVVNKLSNDDILFLANPFERIDSIFKNIEIFAVRRSQMAKVIAKHQTFYNYLGINPRSHPASVLAITEYEQKYDRWRSYGYLFGYPDYAVDFFVNAGKSQDSTKEFVKRDFISIPVYANEKGYFTYAVPKGYQKNETDSLIYIKANQTLSYYKKIRSRFYSGSNKSPIKLWTRLVKYKL